MITVSGKQNDNEVETSIVHLMQMYTYHRGIAEVKIFLPSWPALPDTARGGPRHLQFFFFKCTTALWSGKENGPVNGNAGQSNTDSHYDSQIDPLGELTKYKCLHKICLHKICLHKIGFQMPWWGNWRVG